MRSIKILFGSAALLAGLALAPAARPQVTISVGVQPVCQWGTTTTRLTPAHPAASTGTGYFYDGIFLGMGHGRAGVTGTAGAAIAS